MLLNDMQNLFRETMLDHPDALKNPDADFAALFHDNNIPLPERLKVYRNNIVGGLGDTLIVSFPLLEKLVGRDFLEGMARSFVLKNPPESGCLNTYGRGFDAFIRNFKPAQSLPYLADVAALEIAMTESYYARNDEALKTEELAAIDPEQLGEIHLTPRANIHLIASPYPLDAIRAFCLKEDSGDEKLDLDQGGVNLMIARPDIEVQIVKLDTAEYEMLENLQSGLNLGSAVENILTTHKDFDFQKFLQKHIELETFQTLEKNDVL